MNGYISREKGLVSIIMPAYNAGLFLDRSIASVQRQTYSKWELLIVDDGSEDNSKEIVNSYVSNDPRIKLICNKHAGTARARNTALEEATGEYLSFIDSDDVYHPRFIECLLSVIKNEHADLAICKIAGGMNSESFVTKEVVQDYLVINKEEAFSRMYGGEWPLMISPWNKLYYHTVFETVRFPDGRFFEDASTVNQAIYNCDRICVLSQPLYYYYVTPDSSSKTKRSIELLDREWALRSHLVFFKKCKRNDLLLKALPFYLIELITIYYKIEKSDRPEDSQIIRRQFEIVYKKYHKEAFFTQKQKDFIFAFRYPNLFDIRNMIRKDGLAETMKGFLQRKFFGDRK